MEGYYIGDAVVSKTEKLCPILVIASDRIDALKKYDECIRRHSELVACPDTLPCLLIGVDDFINDQFTEKMIEELRREHSVAVF